MTTFNTSPNLVTIQMTPAQCARCAEAVKMLDAEKPAILIDDTPDADEEFDNLRYLAEMLDDCKTDTLNGFTL